MLFNSGPCHRRSSLQSREDGSHSREGSSHPRAASWAGRTIPSTFQRHGDMQSRPLQSWSQGPAPLLEPRHGLRAEQVKNWESRMHCEFDTLEAVHKGGSVKHTQDFCCDASKERGPIHDQSIGGYHCGSVIGERACVCVESPPSPTIPNTAAASEQ